MVWQLPKQAAGKLVRLPISQGGHVPIFRAAIAIFGQFTDGFLNFGIAKKSLNVRDGSAIPRGVCFAFDRFRHNTFTSSLTAFAFRCES